MRRSGAAIASMVLAGLLALPSVTAGQDGDPTTVEGVDWKLTGYLDPDGGASPEAVDEEGDGQALSRPPLGTSATLRLESGQATGSGGCNTFSGSYSLDGAALSFSDVVSTLVLCDEEVQAIEDAYLGALDAVRGWLISEGVLQLVDEAGSTLLTFEVPDISLTSSELAGLVLTLGSLGSEVAVLRDDLDALDEDVTGIEVDRLRERIRTLETTTRRLTRELELRAEQPAQPEDGFNAAERVLLEGIPVRLANRCQPLRSGRPEGTRAAVTCTPNTELVSRLDYFLMEGTDAAQAFEEVMTRNDVPEATSEANTCEAGRRSKQVYLGSGWVAEGCFRSGGVAQLRFVDHATDCRQLPVPGGRRLRSPAILMALEGTDGDIGSARQWAVGEGGDGVLTRLTRLIERNGQPRTPGCVAGDVGG
jgi:heat shock protein HslJ